ncbi:hypothetical protein IMZ31_23890 (plasmid) [Pontibacillus sp. ALD_SL1]|uniref:hypothetical protein n=1 Tax=Pontibacillus sp. ALD_SL1 TaxID=2777185 RepID=UPI001A963CAC|nr:hypothetical protein [Pontibacillus sp. ALD_SL1]QST02495.1 hypothetical protein IMZ31_23890 [Pontibacillus sp. ALD_SL1]
MIDGFLHDKKAKDLNEFLKEYGVYAYSDDHEEGFAFIDVEYEEETFLILLAEDWSEFVIDFSVGAFPQNNEEQKNLWQEMRACTERYEYEEEVLAESGVSVCARGEERNFRTSYVTEMVPLVKRYKRLNEKVS